MDQHISEVAVESSVQNMNPQMELLPGIVVELSSQQNNDGEFVQPSSIEKESAAPPHGEWKNLILLAYKTLRIVFGSMSTSPLYLYGTMQLDSPTRGDYLGIFSIIFWTMTLSGVAKYGTIALEADDEGEGVVVCILMLITTILLAVVMIKIWRTPKFLVAFYLVIFLLMEGVYVSTVLTKVAEGGWIPLATSLCLPFVMLSWFYDRRRKIQFESAHEINIETLPSLLSDQTVQRVPGVCFFYSNNPDVLTPAFGYYIKTVKSLSEVTIIITLRCLSVPNVASHERFRVTYMGIKGVYGCYVEYGWVDSLDFQDDKLINDITDGLREHLQISSQHNHGEIEEEIHNLTKATLAGVVHVRGTTKFHISRNCRLIDRIILVFYEFMHSNCRSALPALDVVPNQQMDIVMFYET